MSWLARSIANTLNLDDDETNDAVTIPNQIRSTNKPTTEDQQTDDDPSRGVKEDFSELTKTLSRQFWGVASFLAPPPQSEPYKPIQDPNSHNPDDDESDPAGIAGLRSDFAEIGGRFRSGISNLSKNIPVSEITKIASNLLQLEEDEEEDDKFDSSKGAVGVTEEVVAFVRDIAMHPETWLDFPLLDDEDEEVDFDLSDAQQEHALAVERLAPRLGALRFELCPGYMSEARFWEIYFVLLHPRLDKQDAELLSTPQVVKARASLSQELHKRTKPIEEDFSNKETFESTDKNGSQQEKMLAVQPPIEEDWSKKETFESTDKTGSQQGKTLAVPPPIEDDWSKKETVESTDKNSSQQEKMLAVPSTALPADVVHEKSSGKPATSGTVAASNPTISENQTVDNLVVKEGPITNSKDEKLQTPSTIKKEESDEDDGDDWLREESTEIIGASKNSMSIENDEDVSFSDLEEDDDVPSNSKKVNYSSDKDSQDWVQLKKNSTDLSRDASSVNQKGSDKEKAQNPDSKESNDWLDIDDIEVA